MPTDPPSGVQFLILHSQLQPPASRLISGSLILRTVSVIVASELAALTAPSPETIATTGTVIVSLEKNIELGKEVISVKSSTGESILLYTCGNKLTLKGIEIEVNADDRQD